MTTPEAPRSSKTDITVNRLLGHSMAELRVVAAKLVAADLDLGELFGSWVAGACVAATAADAEGGQ